MKNKILKIVTTGLLVSIILSGVVFQIEAVNNKKTLPLTRLRNTRQDALVLDLKDAIEIEKIFMPSASVNTGAEIEAKIKSFEIKGDTNETIESSTKSSTGLITASSAITDPIETGITWLENNQNTDGSWGANNQTEIIDTSAVLSLFAAIEEATTTTAYQDATDWLNLTYPENSEYLAKKVIALSEAEQDAGALPDFLASQINEQDFGFGYQKYYQSDIIITAEVLKAITASVYSDPGTDPTYTLRAALYYLLLSQNSDGGWPKLRNAESDVKTTALVLEALKPYQTFTLGGTPQGDIIIQAKVNFGIYYLKNAQNTDGSWQNIEKTAKAYDVLLNYQQYPTHNQEALYYLLSNQSIDGSFSNQNIYITARALKTIAKPDMTITDIQNTSTPIPNASTTIRITIVNIGYSTSSPVNFKAEPHAFHLIVDGEEIALQYGAESPNTIVFGANSQIDLDVTLLNLPYGPHTIDFLIDYTGVEFDKTNNQKSGELMFDDPGFNGPEPPPWVGVSTGETAGRIKIRWHLSEDSATAYYGIYASTQSGAYDPNILFATTTADIIGINDTLVQELYGIPIYFTVVSFDSNNIRGDYSMESWAIPYENPANFAGITSGQVVDNNGEAVPNAFVDLYFMTYTDANTNGDYEFFYYPGFYWAIAYKPSYTSESKEIKIEAQTVISNVDFYLNIIDDGETPAVIQNLQGTAGDSQITLTWNAFNDTSGDFKNFNIYRAFSEITNVSPLTPIDTSIINSAVTQFTDTNVINNINYYYAITAEDTANNQNPAVTDIGPLKGNSAPDILNINANQNEASQVQIQYDLTDNEQTNAIIDIEYWKDSAWYTAVATIGTSLQNIGTEKSIIWNPQTDYEGYDGTTTIRITADDRQSVNQSSSLESEEFAIYTPVTLTPPSSPGNDWQMFSIPIQMRNAEASAVLSDDLGPIFADWMLAYWQPTEEEFKYHRATCCPWSRSTTSIISLVPGLSYFLGTRLGPYDVDAEGTFVPDSDYYIHLDVSPGATSTWNQISTPFNYSVAWASSTMKIKNTATGETVDLDTAQSNGWIDNTIWWIDDSEYAFAVAPKGQLNPWNGYWVRNFIECDLIIAPTPIAGEMAMVSQQKLLAAKPKTSSVKKELPSWKIQLSVVAGSKKDTYNFAGISPTAENDYDSLDVAEPPVISSGIALYFPHNDWPFAGGDYAQDMRKSNRLRLPNNPKKANLKEWYFEIKNDLRSTPVTLRWTGLEQVEAYQLSLVDLDANQTIDIYNANGYSYTASEKEIRHFLLQAKAEKSK